MNTHKCVRPDCSNTYQDEDVDAYYCPSCREANKAIAEQVEKKLSKRPREEVKTPLQQYDEAQKVRGFMHVRL